MTIENSPDGKNDSLSFSLDDLLERFEDAWSQAKTSPPLLELFLEGVAGEGEERSVVLIELIKIDMEHRWHRAAVDSSLLASADSAVGALPWRVTVVDYYDYFHAIDETLIFEFSFPELWEEQFRVQWRFGQQAGITEFLASLPQRLVPTNFEERLTELEKRLLAEFGGSGTVSPKIVSPKIVSPKIVSPETSPPETFSQSSPQRSTAINEQKLSDTAEISIIAAQRSVQPPVGNATGKNDAGGNDAGRPFGDFLLFEELGRGGFGVVYRAHDISLNCDVALKIPKLTKLSNPEIYEQFFQEAEAAAQLDHPHIVPVFDSGVVDGVPYIVSALAPLGTLSQWLSQPENSLTIQEIIDGLICLSRGVGHAHQHDILHRDLKPGNILIWPNNPELGLETNLPIQLRMSDFGLAKLTEQAETGTSTIIGSPGYMAPEQLTSKFGEQGPATDVFALGVILYELLTGQKPFPETDLVDVIGRVERQESAVPLRKLRKEISRDLETICMKCLQADPVNRYATADELCRDLECVKNNQPISTKRRSLWNRFEAWSRHSARIRDAGLIAMSSGVGLFTWHVVSSTWIGFSTPDLIPPSELIVFGIILFFIVYLPEVWLGQKTLAQKGWAIWAGGAHSAFSMFVKGRQLFSDETKAVGFFQKFYNDNPTTKILVFSVILIITTIQFIFYLFAIRAYRQRQRSER